MSEFTEAAIKKLKVNELKAELSVRGLPLKGKKDELVKRLLEALQEDEAKEKSLLTEGQTEEPMEAEDQDSEVGTSQEDDEDEASNNEEEDQERSNDEEDDSQEVEATGREEEVPAADSSNENSDTEETPIENDNADNENVEEEKEAMTTETIEEPQGDVEEPMVSSTAADDIVNQYCIVNKPSLTVAEDVEKAAKAQDAVLEEQEVTEGKSMEVTESPKKSPKKESPSSEDKLSPKKKSSDKERDSEKTSEKSLKTSEKEKEKEKEVKKEPEIVDKLGDVEDEEGELTENFEVTDSKVVLDPYTSDMNLIITNEGFNCHTLCKNGFSYMWAGARANKGAKGGKIGYELKVVGLIETDLPETEAPINAVRIGWSSENSSLQLGESSLSYGFESTGKVCASSSFFEYGEKFSKGDVIGTYLDLESEPKTLRYTKNGTDLGVAMSLTVNLEEKPLFPHIFLRNIKVELNFGQNEEPWFTTLEGYSLIQDGSEDTVTTMTSKPPTEFSECEVILMVGLPSSGKSYWVKKHVDSHQSKHYNVIGLKHVLDRCKLEGKSRKKSDPTNMILMQSVITILTKLYQLCPKKKRNFIIDQNNVYKVSQETKMNFFDGFKRKAVVVVPTHDNLRRRTSDSKRRGENLVEIPFGDLCDMKCEFHIPEVGDIFEEILYPELDEKNADKTIRDYKTDGSRAKRTGRDEYYPGGKRKRYDDRSGYSGGRRDSRYSGGSRDGRRDDGWRNSGSGYGGYDDKGRSQHSSSGGYKRTDNKSYNDPYRRNTGGSGGGGYRQQSYGGNSYGGSGGNYRGGSNYGSYGSSGNYGSSGGNYGYNNNNNRGNAGWGGQYGNQNQGQQWGSGGGNWGNYNYNSSGNNYGGGNNHSY